jgi:hypothetical protein
VLNLDREINLVWKYPNRPASWLYIVLRYPALVAQILGASLNSYTPKVNIRAVVLNIPTTESLVIFLSYAQRVPTYPLTNPALTTSDIMVVYMLFPSFKIFL